MGDENTFEQESLGTKARVGFTWSLANSFLRRVWTFALGIALARILQPEDFGVFALALASLAILQSMNDLGSAVAIIRWQGAVDRPARTATTISITVSLALYGAVFVVAPAIAGFLEVPSATAVIRVLTFAVVIDGFSGIPDAMLVREFLQKKRLIADIAAVMVNASVAIGLAVAGYGPLSLAWAVVAGNLVAATIIIVVAPLRPVPGYRAQDARTILRIGLPLAGASLLVFAMLNVDYIVLGGILDAAALGFYLLAFNLSSWPPIMLTVAIRNISIPAFSQLQGDRDTLCTRFTQIFGLVATVTFPIAILLSLLAVRLIDVVYGEKWLAASQALVVLAGLGAARVVLDLCYDLLVAVGRSRTVLALQALWFAALVPALVIGVLADGIRGAAFAHLGVAFIVVGPAFAFALRSAGVPLKPLAGALAKPIGATVAMAIAVYTVDKILAPGLIGLGMAAIVGVVVYGALATPWVDGKPSPISLVRSAQPDRVDG